MNYRILEQCYYTQRSVSNIHVTSIPQQCLLLCLSQLLLFMQWHSPRGYVYDESHGWTNSKEMHRRKKHLFSCEFGICCCCSFKARNSLAHRRRMRGMLLHFAYSFQIMWNKIRRTGERERERRVSVTLCNQSITNRVPSSIRSFLIILYYDEAEYPETWMFVPFEM